MTTRSDRLVPAVTVGAGVTTLATVPAGATWLVKSIRVAKLDGAGDVTLKLWLGTLDDAGVLLPTLTIPAAKLGVQDGSWHVAEAGDVIAVETDTAGVLTVRVSGAALEAP